MTRAESYAQVLAQQRLLWRASPRDWAELAERENEPLYRKMLDAGEVGAGTRVLDVACGSGLMCRLAAVRGAQVAGIDITSELLQIARELTRGGDFREGDMGELPFADGCFDVVTGANAFQFSPDPPRALAQAARVLRGGGVLVAAAFAEPERNEGTAMHLAMKAQIEHVEGKEDGYAPYSLSEPGGLEQALRAAGLTTTAAVEVPVTWRYEDRDTALRALLASAGGARAVSAAGHERVTAALMQAMKPFEGEDGVVRMNNLFRYVVGRKAR